MDPNPNQAAEAERNLNIANKLLYSRDLVGAKRFAELAIDSSPQRSDDRPDQILAVADVLLASHKRVNNHHDWYSILQIPPSSSSSSSDLVKRSHRRLSLLLHPDLNRFPGADSAFRLVSDAFAVLSDPSKKSLFDAAHLNLSSSDSDDIPSFWTICNSCSHIHKYPRDYLAKTLRCQICKKPFTASELQKPPSLVPGTDMYYASWGFFPLGAADASDYKPFLPMQNPYPFGGASAGAGASGTPNGNTSSHHQYQSGGGGMTGRNMKKPARKKVMSGRTKSRTFNLGNVDLGLGEEEEEGRGININEAAKGSEDGGVGTEDIEMIIDLDSTDEMLGNLHNLPFMKDDGMNMVNNPFGRAGGM